MKILVILQTTLMIRVGAQSGTLKKTNSNVSKCVYISLILIKINVTNFNTQFYHIQPIPRLESLLSLIPGRPADRKMRFHLSPAGPASEEDCKSQSISWFSVRRLWGHDNTPPAGLSVARIWLPTGHRKIGHGGQRVHGHPSLYAHAMG
jgi:hypothetical protein